ncbi:hypothetical protein JOF56_010994 [Kibdelosporangium banguiense]|uniref:Uncharacterized protein n=1 Tax=Kibdelosporangium banguiense TaxID=1365924 RepID=A0ABS4U338_9PSEU|nr:hypothetical protein [Kibdelosporangium banguiense]
MVLSGDPVGSKWQPHGDVVYRIDRLGARVGILPATCLRGEHSLDAVGYKANQTATHLQIVCTACVGSTPPRWDNYWALRTTPPLPDRAELDDGPYQDLIRKLAAQRTER